MDTKFIVKFLISLLILLLTAACSSYDRNSVSVGDVEFKHGKNGDEKWKTNLVFKRYSLYSDFNLSNEILITKISQDSDFYKWFSIDEKNELSKCGSSYVLLSFSGVEGLKSVEIEKQISSQGNKIILIHNFGKNIKKHPNYNDFNLGEYQISAICGSKTVDIIAFGFPKLSIIQ